MGGEVVSVEQTRGFDEFYQACYGRLLRQLALVTTNLADAEDVLSGVPLSGVGSWALMR